MRALESLQPVFDYLDTKAEIDRLTERLNGLKPLIAAALVDEPEQRYVTRGHEFTLGRRTTYDYSDDVKRMAEDVKAMKQAERSQGVAAFKRASIYPVVRAVPTVVMPTA